MRTNHKAILACLLGAASLIPATSRADFDGSTYILNNPSSLYVASGNVTINAVVASSYDVATLIISNSAANPIQVTWAGPGRAVGAGSTNQLSVPAGQIAAVNVNATLPGLVVYNTQLEQVQPALNVVNSLTPDLLYYKLTEGVTSFHTAAGYFESSPVFLTDSSSHGGTVGTISAVNVPIQWVPNQNGTLTTAVHYNGASTVLDTGNSGLFNFTNNLFTINLWVRNLTYPCAFIGTGLYRTSGWYVIANTAGDIVVAAEGPGTDNYVATTSTVASVGQWVMVTVVRTSANSILIYKNGQLQQTIGSFSNPAPCSNDMILGDNYYGNQYDGDLGTLRIYSRPLSQTEINQLYQQDTTP